MLIFRWICPSLLLFILFPACQELPAPEHTLSNEYAFFGIAVDPPSPRPEETITLYDMTSGVTLWVSATTPNRKRSAAW